MKKCCCLVSFMVLVIGLSVAFAADESVVAFINSLPLPAWAKMAISAALGVGAAGALFGGFLFKVIPGFTHAITVIKKLLTIYTKAKPILQDTYNVEKYGNILGEINETIDEVEEFCNDTKIVKTRDFLEKFKIKTVNTEKVIAALKASPVVAAGDAALDEMDKK